MENSGYGDAPSGGRETQPSCSSDADFSLRRRHVPPGGGGGATSATSPPPYSSTKASSSRTESSSATAESSDESGVEFDSGGGMSLTDRIGEGSDDGDVGGKRARTVENGEDYDGSIGKVEVGAARGVQEARFAYRASAPAHRRVKESPLSSDSIFKQSHAGLFNLCIVVLVAVNSRLIIENLMKYGLLIKAGFWFSSWSLRDWPLLMCCLMLPVFPLCSYIVEKLAQCKILSEPFIVLLHVIITTAAILYPVFVILRCDSAVLSGITLMLLASIVWLKLVSYAHTNYHLRASSNSVDKVDNAFNRQNLDCQYDVSVKSLSYFMVAPTLCYQLTYPRSTCIRKGWVIRQSIKLVVFTGLMGFIVEQYMNPIVKNSQHPLKGNFLYAIERVLKLSVPTLYVWLCMFYCFFHLWFNILAELLRFGDREFYKDWWNAKTVEEYWRMWNMPVHKWMVRHVYVPCLTNGLSKNTAFLIAFLVSAVFHELCIAVPCHIFKFWAFIGILFQVPLIILTNYLQRKFRNDMVGNMIFWSFFSIFGQPMCVLLYYHDVMNRKVGTK